MSTTQPSMTAADIRPAFLKTDSAATTSTQASIPVFTTLAIHPPQQQQQQQHTFANPWVRARHALRQPLAEFLGTTILVLFGTAVNCQVALASTLNGAPTHGDYLTVCFGWGVGLCLGVFVSAGVSGAHLNPAITLALAVFRGFEWRKVPRYMGAQMVGGVVGALITYGLYAHAIRLADPGQTEATAGLFATYPATYLRTPAARPTAFFNELLATAILLLIVFAMGDAANSPTPEGYAPFTLLWGIMGISAVMGWQTSFALNMARDLGPRIALAIVGYSSNLLWSFNAYYFLWSPILGTFTGGLVGALVYDALIYTGTDSPLNRAWSLSKKTSSLRSATPTAAHILESGGVVGGVEEEEADKSRSGAGPF